MGLQQQNPSQFLPFSQLHFLFFFIHVHLQPMSQIEGDDSASQLLFAEQSQAGQPSTGKKKKEEEKVTTFDISPYIDRVEELTWDLLLVDSELKHGQVCYTLLLLMCSAINNL